MSEVTPTEIKVGVLEAQLAAMKDDIHGIKEDQRRLFTLVDSINQSTARTSVVLERLAEQAKDTGEVRRVAREEIQKNSDRRRLESTKELEHLVALIQKEAAEQVALQFRSGGSLWYQILNSKWAPLLVVGVLIILACVAVVAVMTGQFKGATP